MIAEFDGGVAVLVPINRSCHKHLNGGVYFLQGAERRGAVRPKMPPLRW